MADIISSPALTTVFKLTTGNPVGTVMYQYFTEAGSSKMAAELIALAKSTSQAVTIESFQADLTRVDLTSFLAGGGMLIGPLAIT